MTTHPQTLTVMILRIVRNDEYYERIARLKKERKYNCIQWQRSAKKSQGSTGPSVDAYTNDEETGRARDIAAEIMHVSPASELFS